MTERPETRSLAARAALGLAGPALIVGGVLAVLNGFAFDGMFSSQFRDVPQYWLPTHCFLGRAIAAGDIPGWNPLKMAGEPFAADPQSGWMYLPAMALYATLPCDVAVRAYLVLQPILAGLGVYWFLRSEGASRVSSTFGGVAISLGLAGARDLLTPYAAAVAWSAVTLAAASRCLHAERWSARVAWAALTAIGWGQIAGAHMSQGLLMGTIALIAYLAARTLSDVASRRRSPMDAIGTLALLAVVVIPLNLAVLLPRLAYVPESTLGLGYERLDALGERLAGAPIEDEIPGPPLSYAWPIRLATVTGRYLGALPLALAFAGVWSRRHRAIAVGFAAYAAVLYLGTLRPVVTWVDEHLGSSLLAASYLRGPNRLGSGVVLGISVLGALGLEAWREREDPIDRAAMVLPGLAVWGLLWVPLGIPPGLMLLPLIGAAGVLPVLVASARRAGVLALVPLMLAVEVSANAITGQRYGAPIAPGGVQGALAAPRGEGPLLMPDLDAARWLTRGPIVLDMLEGGRGRFVWLAPPVSPSTAGHPSPNAKSAMQRFRPSLFGIEGAEGYDPVQQLRYWTFVRKVTGAPLAYNRTFFRDVPPPFALDLLQVGWLIVPRTLVPPAPWEAVVGAGTWRLYRRDAPPRATLHGAWTVAPSGAASLDAVTSAVGTDGVVLETNPAIAPAPGAPAGTAVTRTLGTQALRIETRAREPALLLVRNSYDPHWRATIDGAPAPVLRAEYFLQAIPVPAGEHVVLLRYADPAVGRGLVCSAIVLIAMIAVAVLLAWLERRRRAATPPPDA